MINTIEEYAIIWGVSQSKHTRRCRTGVFSSQVGCLCSDNCSFRLCTSAWQSPLQHFCCWILFPSEAITLSFRSNSYFSSLFVNPFLVSREVQEMTKLQRGFSFYLSAVILIFTSEESNYFKADWQIFHLHSLVIVWSELVSGTNIPTMKDLRIAIVAVLVLVLFCVIRKNQHREDLQELGGCCR